MVMNSLVMENAAAIHGEFAKMMIHNQSLTHLFLDSVNMDTNSAINLIDSLVCAKSRLVALSLCNNCIGAECGRSIGAYLAVSVLEQLHLQHNSLGIGIEGMCTFPVFHYADFAPSLARSQLKILNLEGNNIGLGKQGVLLLAQALAENKSLTTLNLSENSINEECGVSLAFALSKNSTLLTLDLSQNPLKNPTAFAFGEILSSSNLLHLDLSGCAFADEGALSIAGALASRISTSGLLTLKMRENFVSRAAGAAVVELLNQNHSLLVIDFRGNQFEVGKLNRLKDITLRNEWERKDEEPRRLRGEVANLKDKQKRMQMAEEEYLVLFLRAIYHIQEYEVAKKITREKIEQAVERKKEIYTKFVCNLLHG